MRTLCVGDIHGSFKGLRQCLERAKVTKEDKLIFLGDYSDGFSQTAELVEHLIQLAKTNECIFIKGNHDAWAGEWLENGAANKIWLMQGGQATCESYVRSGHITSDEHRKFFRTLRDYYIDDENRAFMHGGFSSRKGVGYEPYNTDYYWDRDLWTLALMSHGRIHEEPNLSKGISHSRRWENHKEIYIGHTATENWNVKPSYPEYGKEGQAPNGPITVPMNRCNVWNLDTGAGFGGRLTIMDIDSKEYWQSDSSKELYPNEMGR